MTQSQYNDFVASSPDIGEQPTGCEVNANFSPACDDGSDVPGGPTLPAVCVDWCDAAAYCKWAGKRLCPAATEGLSMWETACTAKGSPPDAAQCNLQSGILASVGQYACHSNRAPFDQVFDLLGNAEEWTEECSGETCFALGGAAWSNNSFCTGGTGYTRKRADTFLGFRCCAV
ncbi:MAG: SUMF1/EgtB/PvdO family nonheme iron enzyme [Myxococcales bacterium]|nr:SUMF1/EgtB/PvdO family nonheme iron enzyme [Myxococcales bacterium]